MEENTVSGANAKRIRILLVDGQSIFREGLAERLNIEKDFVAVAETGIPFR